MNEIDERQRSAGVLVVGAGISGMQSALLLAEAGHKVYMLDSAPAIGGSMHLLDRTFPTDSCGLCLMLPGRAAYCPTIECDLSANIEIVPNAEVLGIDGEPGDFTVTLRHKPRFVREDRCNQCGLCAAACPVQRPDRYEGDLDRHKAIFRPPARAVPGAYVIDMDFCNRCGACVEVCPVDAIDLDMTDRTGQVQVGAVILGPGFEPYNARRKGEYGFGHYDNVITSIQYERLISLSGSTGADIVRPSDGQTPRRIAFIQCVGSRDAAAGLGYCSSVCCRYTAKQIAVTKRIQPDMDVTVFFMDIRAHGKDFDEYFDAVEALPGVHYQRAMVSSVYQHQKTRDLQLNYVDDGGALKEDEFDLVVLSVGFAPPMGAQELGRSLGVELNPFGFCMTHTFSPNDSSRPGILVSGAFREPKDIPDTVVEASAVAADAACLLGSLAEALPIDRSALPLEAQAASEETPRVGVFLCTCRGEIADVIDLQDLASKVGQLQDVVSVHILDNACLLSGRTYISQAASEEGINRVVVAGCASRQYQAAFERMMREVGLDPGWLESANMLGECVRVHPHSDNGASAHTMAEDLVSMAVTSARGSQSRLVRPAGEVLRRGLVIGGGLAGLTAASTLAQMGFEVDLVEQSASLGGQLRELQYTLEERDPAGYLRALIDQVEADERIHIHLESRVVAVSGLIGRYTTTIADTHGQETTLTHGAIVVATGGHEAIPNEYLFDKDPRVITQRQLEQMLADGSALPDRIVMIHCVGSREPERPYCSRVCCTKAITNAIGVLERNPRARIVALYRELRSFGFREEYYRQAREAGVVFLRYSLAEKPKVNAAEDGLMVRTRDSITGEELVIPADLLVLNTGIEPNDGRELAAILDVELDENGFFQEEHPKMRPLDFTRPGIFVSGLAHSPRSVDETIEQAKGAAMRAAVVLARRHESEMPVAIRVDPQLCAACERCVHACPFGARAMTEDGLYVRVIDALCQGCGSCVAACPNKATLPYTWAPAQVLAMTDAAELWSIPA